MVLRTITVGISEQKEITRIAKSNQFTVMPIEDIVAVGKIDGQGLRVDARKQGMKEPISFSKKRSLPQKETKK